MTTDGGAGDAARRLAVLWQTGRPGARGPKPAHRVEEIARAAIEIADAEGLPAVTMRRVADRLGTGTMSLYRYVRTKAELAEIMLDTVLGEIPIEDDTDKGWRTKLESYARETWALVRRHPWMVQISFTRGLIGPHQARVVESALRAVSGLGLTDGQMIAVFTLVSSYVRGAAWSVVEEAGFEQRSGMSEAQWWTELAPHLNALVTADTFPLQARVWGADDAGKPEEVFEFGLQRLLDGIELLVRDRD